MSEFFRALPFFALLGLCLFLSACSSDSGPIKIGLAVNLSGPSGHAGAFIREGALLAVRDINEAGGIIGRPLELLVRDDRNLSDKVLAVDKELIDAGVIAIIGHISSQNTLTANTLINENDSTLLITAYTAATALSGKDDLFFRTSVDNVQYGKVLARLLLEQGVKRSSVAMDLSNSSFVKDYVRQAERQFTGNMHQVHINSRKQVDWDSAVAALLANDPQAIVLLTRVNGTAILAQKLRAKGFDGALIASIWAQAPGLMELGSTAVEGMQIITFIDPHYSNEQYTRLAERMQKIFHVPLNARSIRSYEVVQILAAALRRCSSEPTAQELKQELLDLEFTGPMGKLRFDRFGDISRPIYLLTVENGRFMKSKVMN
jgi:branched-chain amino acid transport system substrate-binding protein